MTSTNTPTAAPANDHQLSPAQDPDRADAAAEDHVLAAAARAVAAVDTGRLVDRLTGTWTQWNLVKDRDDPAGVDLASALLNHVSELSIGYDDLIADLRGGCRRLPRHQNPIAPIAA